YLRIAQCITLLISYYTDHPHLRSFPTRRSSDLALKEALKLSVQTGSPSLYGEALGELLCSLSRKNRDPEAAALASIIFRKLRTRSEEHTSELQSRENLVCRLLLEKKKYHT